MPFIKDILQHRSLSIVGLEKNTGKTVCLNYILHRMNELGVHVGVTSIGVDGEQVDAVLPQSPKSPFMKVPISSLRSNITQNGS